MPLFLRKEAHAVQRRRPKCHTKAKNGKIQLKIIPENAKIALKCHFCTCKNNAGAVQ
jgi:hypothetical protein